MALHLVRSTSTNNWGVVARKLLNSPTRPRVSFPWLPVSCVGLQGVQHGVASILDHELEAPRVAQAIHGRGPNRAIWASWISSRKRLRRSAAMRSSKGPLHGAGEKV